MRLSAYHMRSAVTRSMTTYWMKALRRGGMKRIRFRSSRKLIVRAGKYNGRFEFLCLLKIHGSVRNDDDDVADLSLAGSGSVKAYRTGTARATDHVGVQAFPVVNVYDLYFFPFDKVSRVHQVLIDGDASHVVEFGLGDLDPMNFGLQDFNSHCLV